MNAPARLGLFAATLVIAFASAYGIAALVTGGVEQPVQTPHEHDEGH